MANIRFDGKVAIVTGAGGGLGRQHALELARRGAKVLVNDLGGSVDGSGGGSEADHKVVDEIKALGGEAIANGSSVTDDAGVALMVKQAMDAWGRIDVLIANAGVLRDKSFSKMEIADFEFVLDVHLMGTVKPAKAVWEIMREQNYGRIVVTTSSSGLYGNFGQTNYGAAQGGIAGFTRVLAIEGRRYGIRVWGLAPGAYTRMTSDDRRSDAVLASSRQPLRLRLNVPDQLVALSACTQLSAANHVRYRHKHSPTSARTLARALPTALLLALTQRPLSPRVGSLPSPRQDAGTASLLLPQPSQSIAVLLCC